MGLGERRTVPYILPLVGEDDLAAAAWRVDGESLVEAVLDVRAPHSLRITLPRSPALIILPPAPRRGGGRPLRRRGGSWGVEPVDSWRKHTGQINTRGDVAQEVRCVVCRQSEGLPVRSHPGRVEVSLGKTPNP